ncbi:MAG: hypothetical protein KGS72_25770 [Cyanobacteria bacterium REEB67]|nr:hypothetical protein [Cyanobacteria bacterium REEB67]
MTKAQSIKLVAAARNNDTVTLLGWSWDEGVVIPGCLGFSIKRTDVKTGVEENLVTYLPFEGQPDNKAWKPQPTTVWPIQRNSFLDFTGKRGSTYKYEIQAMGGQPGALVPIAGVVATTNEITLTTKVTDWCDIGFTRGVLSTQWLAHMIGLDKEGNPDFQKIIDALADYKNPNNPIRETLMANVPEMLMAPVNNVKANGGHVYSAIYELSASQLVDFFLANIQYFSMILGNTGADDKTNAAARAALHAISADVLDRIIGAWGIPHNKSQIEVDAKGVPYAVTTGSTNLTDTGMGCQSNMAIRIFNLIVAANYKDYWDRLKADASQQSLAFRRRNAQGYAPVKLADGTIIEQYFQPSMDDKTKPRGEVPLSPFLKRVKGIIEDAAKDGDSIIIGEVFYPGNPSVVQWFAEAWDSTPTNFMAMTVSTPDALRGVTAKRRKGRPPLFTIAQGREKDFADFVKEILKLPEAHAITHGKIIVVINKRTGNFYVIGGSDNLGAKASYGNDENAFIIIGNEAIAWWVFTNLFDINKHYLSRAAARSTKTVQQSSGWTGRLATTDAWQKSWTNGYKAREAKMIATGYWDGSGFVDPAGLKSVPVIFMPPRKPGAASTLPVKPAA